jgi:hypothetical protein
MFSSASVCVCPCDDLSKIYQKYLYDKICGTNCTLPKDKLIKFRLNLEEHLEEKLVKVCLPLSGRGNV